MTQASVPDSRKTEPIRSARAAASAAGTVVAASNAAQPSRAVATVAGLGLTFDIHVTRPHRFREHAGITPDDWQAFETAVHVGGGTATLFLSWRWLQAWTATAAAPFGETPVIAIGRRPTGEIAVVLPLALATKFGRPVLVWLGAGHHGCALPIASPAAFVGRSADAIAAVVDAIARRVGADAVYLTDQPAAWSADAAPAAQECGSRPTHSTANVLASIRPTPAANDYHVLDLADDFPLQYATTFSAKNRSQLRRKMRRLGDIGPVTISSTETLAERLQALDVFFAQKRVQLAAQGAGDAFSRAEIRAFYRELADDDRGRRPRMDVTALHVGGRIAAIILAMRHGNRLYLLNTSYTAEPDLADASPGRMLIHAHVAACHAAGVRTYDFGPGDAPYKADWRATPVQLSAAVRAVTLPGVAVAAALDGSLRLRRFVKRTPAVWRAVRSARRILAGSR